MIKAFIDCLLSARIFAKYSQLSYQCYKINAVSSSPEKTEAWDRVSNFLKITQLL